MSSRLGIRCPARPWLLFLLLPWLLACQEEVPEEPVAELFMEPARLDLPAGHTLPLALRWNVLTPLSDQGGEPVVFVHLLDAEGEIRLTLDHPFPTTWQPGKEALDPLRLYHSSLAPALPAGTYRLTAGLYRGEQRFALKAGPDIGRQEYELGKVVVPAVESAGPRYLFSESWGAAQPSSDRQTLARRWLGGDGTLQISKIPGPGSLWLVLRLPGVRDGMQLVLDEGASEPTLHLTGDCGVTSTELRGESTHHVKIPLVPSPQPCLLRFDTNFHLVNLETLGTATLILEQLGWETSKPA